MNFRTRCVQEGVHKDQQYNSVTTPIYPSSTFYWDSLETNSGYDYTRSGNPTRDALQENLASLEGGVSCVATSSGMSAVHCATAIFKPGDHLIAPIDLYGGTFRLFKSFLEEKGVAISLVDMCDHDAVRQELRPETAGIWIETPSNPLMKIVDIAAIVDIARSANAVTIADNTFLSPYLQRPFEFGVDIVMHSTTCLLYTSPSPRDS